MKNLAKLLFLPLFLFVSGMSLNASDMHDLEQEVIKISEKAKKSVASIKVEITEQRRMTSDPFFDFFFGHPQQPRTRKGMAQGTGFVIDEKEGFIVTNNHVVEKAEKIEVTIDGKTFNAKLIGTDPHTDIGLVKIEDFKKGEIQEIKFADSDKIKVGSFAIAIGNPFGLSNSVTFGIISAKGRSGMRVTDYEDFIQTDAAINPGNSGGPLLNIEGEVIGMNTAILSQSGGYMGIGLAVPANMIKDITQQLRSGRKIQRAMMGIVIQELNDDMRSYFEIDKTVNGILVAGVEPKSPADKAGIQQYDLITRFDGKEIENVSQFRTAVAFSPYGRKIPVEIIRNGKKMNLNVVMEKDYQLSETPQELDRKVLDEIGLTLTDGKGKVTVSNVEQGSLAYSAGIMNGDVIAAINRKRVKNASEANKIINSSKKLLFTISRNGRDFIVVINR
ncbi:Do family serine endopeptidase [bacterium]|nr:Do family serine endopeptidase [bacterium]